MHRMIREGLAEKAVFERRPEGAEGVLESIPGRANSGQRGLETECASRSGREKQG